MAVTIDSGKLQGKLTGKYGAYTEAGNHMRYYWDIDGKRCGGAKVSHGSKQKDLPDFVASSIARKLGVTRQELKVMESCSFDANILLQRLRVVSGLNTDTDSGG